MNGMKYTALFLGVMLLFGFVARAQESDVTPPEIVSAVSNPGYLWPPNHKMVEVKISAILSDDTDLAPTFTIVSVESSEPELDADEGEEATSPDWVIVNDTTVDLRAERTGKHDGRTYTITIEASDASGNTTTGVVEVLVPHDQGDMRLYRRQVKEEWKAFKRQQKAARKEEKEREKNE